MASKIYNKRMVAFLTENYPNHFADELTKMFNKEFGKKQTVEQIRGALKSRNIKAGGNRTKRLYTDEHLAWIEETYKELNIKRMTLAFNEKFKMKVSESSMRACTRNHGFKSGRTGMYEKGQKSWNKGMKGLRTGGDAGWFKPGHMPINHRPLGSERVSVDGYIEIKIGEPATWDLKHRVVWRKHNGEISSDELICFRNNDTTDCRIENLFLSSRREHAIMNKFGYSAFSDELKDSARALVKLRNKTKDLA